MTEPATSGSDRASADRIARRTTRVLLRAAAILWALPTTLVGLIPLALAAVTGGRVSRVEGVLEAHGGWVRRVLMRLPIARGGGAALTLGHVVLGTSASALVVTRAHERAHVAQCERWGPLFLPAYAAASLWAWLSGGDPYRDNRFERAAHAAAPAGGPLHPMATRPGAARA